MAGRRAANFCLPCNEKPKLDPRLRGGDKVDNCLPVSVGDRPPTNGAAKKNPGPPGAVRGEEVTAYHNRVRLLNPADYEIAYFEKWLILN